MSIAWLDEAYSLPLKNIIMYELYSETLFKGLQEFDLDDLRLLNAVFAFSVTMEDVNTALKNSLIVLSDHLAGRITLDRFKKYRLFLDDIYGLTPDEFLAQHIGIYYFTETVSFVSGKSSEAPVPVLDTIMARAFGFPKDGFSGIDLYEVGILFFIKLRDLINKKVEQGGDEYKKVKETIGNWQAWQLQSVVWWKMRSELFRYNELLPADALKQILLMLDQEGVTVGGDKYVPQITPDRFADELTRKLIVDFVFENEPS
jgi:hypothetical protein